MRVKERYAMKPPRFDIYQVPHRLQLARRTATAFRNGANQDHRLPTVGTAGFPDLIGVT
jgi:hypothetical protein